MANKFRLLFCYFFLQFIIFVPMPFLGYVQGKTTGFLFSKPVDWVAKNYLNEAAGRIDFSSDSYSLFILIGFLITIAPILLIIIPNAFSGKIIEFTRKALIYYLATILFKYGIDKIFGTQFYAPEPNILYTRLGNLDKDILFWSTMGVSKTYPILTGMVEILVSVLLAVKKTRILGLILSIFLLSNILFINFGFDISVKTFSIILLLMAIFALEKDLRVIFNFLVLKKTETLSDETSLIPARLQPLQTFIKTALLGCILVKIMLPYIPFKEHSEHLLHGTFEVQNKNSNFRYLFFHKNQYLIFMDQNEKMTDFHYEINASQNKIIIEDYHRNRTEIPFSYKKNKGILKLNIGGKILETKELEEESKN